MGPPARKQPGAKHAANSHVSPFFTTMFAFWFMLGLYLMGKLRDLLEAAPSKRTRKGYAPLREKKDDFYQRRFYTRLRDCWNRPIASAPDAWIDVCDRTDLEFTSGFRPLDMKGTTTRCFNLGSYNYLGFANKDPYCTPRVHDTLNSLAISACCPRATAGTTTVHEELEEEVAAFVGAEAAIVYGMGYATNSVVIPAIVDKHCLIISDQLNHASIVAGARTANAKVKVFKHNNMKHLESVLRRSIAEGQPRTHRPWKKVLIIVEGIYSMEGETCLLPEIVALKKKYKAYLYLDEAHSIGAMGKTGRGCCEYWGVDPRDVDILMGTFTKSFGSCGGYIAGARTLIDHLKRHGPGHLYATAMPPAAAQQALSAMRLICGKDGTNRGQLKVRQLHDNANYFRERLMELGMHVLGDRDSPVMPIMIYNPGKLAVFSRTALRSHLAVVVVGFPATELLAVRARICISAAHSREDLDYALQELSYVADISLVKYALTGAQLFQSQLALSSPKRAAKPPRSPAATTPSRSGHTQQQEQDTQRQQPEEGQVAFKKGRAGTARLGALAPALAAAAAANGLANGSTAPANGLAGAAAGAAVGLQQANGHAVANGHSSGGEPSPSTTRRVTRSTKKVAR